MRLVPTVSKTAAEFGQLSKFCLRSSFDAPSDGDLQRFNFSMSISLILSTPSPRRRILKRWWFILSMSFFCLEESSSWASSWWWSTHVFYISFQFEDQSATSIETIPVPRSILDEFLSLIIYVWIQLTAFELQASETKEGRPSIYRQRDRRAEMILDKTI